MTDADRCPCPQHQAQAEARAAVNACPTCSGDDECSNHRTYRCDTRRQRWPWSDGCADDMPGSCDECWDAAHNPQPMLVEADHAR